ncbi:IS256 family transposase [Virgibacillus sp. NKC19-3]|uniref:IS256 family transposase n=1 Tax=Virgibacillus saliphilus TaxID=2831674 RepID=UPI001C9AA2A5|nr:IS256 family transposase [Virgibacillus sp. NKC19-3]MBY7141986.1 IS256 family transposase [Virgibacillus sp. NKC19-3]
MTQINFTVNFNELKEKLLESNLDDILKSTMVLVLHEYMKQEQTDYLNVPSYERSAGRRDYRNGYYERELLMSIGKVPLQVPRTRSGEFHTTAFEKYERSDQSFLLALVEMVVNGVSTRKVTNVVEQLCGEKVSKSFVSSLTEKLDPVVEEWSNRSLSEIYYPYVFVDAMYIKVREHNRIVSKAVYIATGIGEDAKRHVLGFTVDHEENYEAWKDFLTLLTKRGLKAPKMVISDAHEGLRKAIQRVFVGTSWQRCTVHFKRNVIDKLPKKGMQEVKNDFKRIYDATSQEEARKHKNEFIEKYEDNPKIEKAIKTLEEGFEDTIQYLVEPPIRQKFIRSTNSLERLNGEIRRRERVIRIFPNNQSAVRLIGSILMDSDESGQKKKALYK